MGRGSSKASGGTPYSSDVMNMAERAFDPNYGYDDYRRDVEQYMKAHPGADQERFENDIEAAMPKAERNLLTKQWNGKAEAKYASEVKAGDTIDTRMYSGLHREGVQVAGGKGEIKVQTVNVGQNTTKITGTVGNKTVSVETGNNRFAKVYKKKRG